MDVGVVCDVNRALGRELASTMSDDQQFGTSQTPPHPAGGHKGHPYGVCDFRPFQWNCSASVEPTSAVVEDMPLAIAWATSSK